jgi:hypothetical protein
MSNIKKVAVLRLFAITVISLIHNDNICVDISAQKQTTVEINTFSFKLLFKAQIKKGQNIKPI